MLKLLSRGSDLLSEVLQVLVFLLELCQLGSKSITLCSGLRSSLGQACNLSLYVSVRRSKA
ncbi:hypothetical protein ACETIH_16960 [Microvirga arabica]|uniref:Uncharacterized protein n=1 Tax=Microvirga arabica TaxID=1128671 RepID=A0ABV6YBG4_9HYPH